MCDCCGMWSSESEISLLIHRSKCSWNPVRRARFGTASGRSQASAQKRGPARPDSTRKTLDKKPATRAAACQRNIKARRHHAAVLNTQRGSQRVLSRPDREADQTHEAEAAVAAAAADRQGDGATLRDGREQSPGHACADPALTSEGGAGITEARAAKDPAAAIHGSSCLGTSAPAACSAANQRTAVSGGVAAEAPRLLDARSGCVTLCRPAAACGWSAAACWQLSSNARGTSERCSGTVPARRGSRNSRRSVMSTEAAQQSLPSHKN